MSTVLICRDALEDSVLGSLALARTLARRGGSVAVVFAGEALRALVDGTFRWSPNFKTREAQAEMIAAAENAGLPMAHRDLDPRWSDVRGLVRSLAAEPELRMLACPLWSRLLGLEGDPDYLEKIDEEDLAGLLHKADTVIGGY